MPELNRGKILKGYFVTNPKRPRKLFGCEWENAIPCGTFVNKKGVLKAVTFVMMYENELPDNNRGTHKESLDLDLLSLDSVIGDAILEPAIKEQPIAAAKLIALDESQRDDVDKLTRLERGKIVGRELIKLMPEYLGRTLDQSIKRNPIIWQPTTDQETGIETGNIMRCSLESD